MDNKILEKGYWGENIEARVEGDTLILSGTGGMNNFNEFNRRKLGGIKRIVIEKGITSIGDCVFIGNKLISVIIPDSVKVIGSCLIRKPANYNNNPKFSNHNRGVFLLQSTN